MYQQQNMVQIAEMQKGEPFDLYILKRGASLDAVVVTAGSYRTQSIPVQEGIREVPDFTRMCSMHDLPVVKDPNVPKQYQLIFEFAMCGDLVSIDGYPCRPAEFPEQLIDCLSGN